VTNTVYFPGTASGSAVNVSVLSSPAVILDGLNAAVTSAGKPETLRAIVCADPSTIALDTSVVTLPPGATDRLLGVAVSEKSDSV
jgi:hypothetical protein